MLLLFFLNLTLFLQSDVRWALESYFLTSNVRPEGNSDLTNIRLHHQNCLVFSRQ